MVTWFAVIFTFVVLQRLLELVIAKRNARHIKSLGGYEVGASHYPYIVALHACFLLSLLAEVYERGRLAELPHLIPFALFLLAQCLRVWALLSLGRFWNTRIFVLPRSHAVERGPYRFLRHPNYTVVAVELLTLPLACGAPLTAVVFSLLNAVVLRVRIRTEELALLEVTDYRD
ncbi:MAG: isoprenylcysteine carboxyl methyltransferase family protein, partial [Tumebacillaceae bacterium]